MSDRMFGIIVYIIAFGAAMIFTIMAINGKLLL